jgi:DNA-binding NarL/FixJ family response regulator
MLDFLDPRHLRAPEDTPASASAHPLALGWIEPGRSVAGAIVIVAPEDIEREPLAQTARDVDPARPLAFVSPTWDSPAPGERPALLLVDLDALGEQGPAAVKACSARWPGVPLAAVGSAVDDTSIDSVLRAGASTYVPRCYSRGQMLLALRLTLAGAAHRPHFNAPRDAPGVAVPEEGLPNHRLTRKQVEVLSLAAEGLANRQIATRLSITEGTVKLHMSAIYAKLAVERRGEAIVMAHRLREVRAEQMRRVESGGAQVLDWLLPHVVHRRAAPGETIFRKGDRGSGLFYIQRGRVALEDIGVELGPRQILGEISVFSPEHTRTCTARCVTEVDLFCLDSEQVKSIYCLNPQFGLHVVQLIAQRLLADRQRGD